MTRKLKLSEIEADRRRVRVMYVDPDGYARSLLTSAATMRLATWLSDEAAAAFLAQTWRDTFRFKKMGVPFAFRREKADIDDPSVAVDDWVFFAGKPGKGPKTWLPPDSSSTVYIAVGEYRVLGGRPEPESPAATAEEFDSPRGDLRVVQVKWTGFLGNVETSTLPWGDAEWRSADEVAEWLRTTFPSIADTATEYRFGLTPIPMRKGVDTRWMTWWSPLPKPGSAKPEPATEEYDPGWRSRPGVEAGV